MLEYCNGFGPVCFNSLSPSFESWTSGSHAIASASIVQRPPMPQTAMGTWTPSLACWVTKCRVFGRVPLQHVLQWWLHTCWRYAGERNLRACILQQHRGPMPRVMVWGAIGFNMRSCLLRIEGNLNSSRYMREVLQTKVLPLLQPTPHAIFQQDNARPYVARIVQVFFQKWQVSLLPWPVCSPDMSLIKHVWDMVGWRHSSGSSSAYSWCFVDLHTHCVEGHSPGRLPGPLWFHATMHRDSVCSAWRLHTILKSHSHRPCTVL